MTFILSDFLQSGSILSVSHDRLLVGWGEPHYASSQEMDHCKPAFYFIDFFLTTARPWIQYSNWMEIAREEFQALLRSSQALELCTWTFPPSEKFKKVYEELMHLLESGQLQKGVPYLFVHSSHLMDQVRLHFSLKKGLASLEKKVGYLYGHWHLAQGVLGITPELLFSHTQQRPQQVQTMALAGTCRASQDPLSFLENQKERYEHHCVVEGICQAVQSLGSVKVGEIQLIQLPHLAHLMTPIEIDLQGSFDFETLVNALHPTPALGAFPKEAGKAWLSQFQQHTPRHFYGAPIGFQCFATGRSQCVVGIRNVQWNQAGMRIGAGCGVVKHSVFDKEWQEIQLKVKAIRDQFHL